MPYVLEVVKAGRTIETRKYYTPRYYSKGEKRRKKSRPTKEEVKRINFRNRVRKLGWILNENFGPGDIHLRLSYRREEAPKDKEEMQKIIRLFLEKMRKEYRRAGKELKYVHVFEIGKRGARHHHLVMNSIDTKLIRKCWPHGYIHTSLLDDTGQYSKLAEYLLKFSGRNVGKWTGKSYSKSKNLVIPVPKKRIISGRDMYREEAVPKKGYYIDQDTVRSGETIYGYKFFSYIMIELERRKDG
ncbi:MAG: hypothetical protein ACI4E3_03365 [Candidatus Fimousia sp.]